MHAQSRMLNGSTAMNPPSRFLTEIPAELTESIVSEGAGYPRRLIFNEEPELRRSHTTPAAVRRHSEISKAPSWIAYSANASKNASEQFMSFVEGDRVRHTTFGIGTVISVKEMGKDKLYEIEFETVGMKKLMATYARLTKAE